MGPGPSTNHEGHMPPADPRKPRMVVLECLLDVSKAVIGPI